MDLCVAAKISCLFNSIYLEPRDIKIFHMIIEVVNADRGYVSNKLLINRTSYSERTISTSLTNLKKCGLISIESIDRKNFIICHLNHLINENEK